MRAVVVVSKNIISIPSFQFIWLIMWLQSDIIVLNASSESFKYYIAKLCSFAVHTD